MFLVCMFLFFCSSLFCVSGKQSILLHSDQKTDYGHAFRTVSVANCEVGTGGTTAGFFFSIIKERFWWYYAVSIYAETSALTSFLYFFLVSFRTCFLIFFWRPNLFYFNSTPRVCNQSISEKEAQSRGSPRPPFESAAGLDARAKRLGSAGQGNAAISPGSSQGARETTERRGKSEQEQEQQQQQQ